MRARRLSPALIPILTAILGLCPGVSLASNLVVHGVAGSGGTTCALTGGRAADAGLAATCGNGNGNTLNAIYLNNSGTVSQGASAQAWIDAPSGVSIDSISLNYCSNMHSGDGWGGGSFWGPGSKDGNDWPAANCSSNSTGQWSDYPEGVSRYGFQIVCGQASCSGGYAYVPSFTLSATETTQPSLIAVGTDNIWYQGGKWLWNPSGDPWSASLVGSDATGVCRYQWSVGGAVVGQSYPQNDKTWQQCPNNTAWNTSVDTAAYPNGPVTYQVEDWNAAGIANSNGETLDVDNQAPSVSLTPAAGPSTGSAVTVDVQASAGPSGVAGLSCTDNGAPLTITDGTVTLSDDGTHHVDCQVVNNAVDPQGQHNTGSAALLVQTATSRVPVLSRKRAPDHVNVPVVIGWSWSGRQTVLRHVTIGHLARRAQVRLTCAGAGCPWKKLSASRRSVARLQRRLAGIHFSSGDVLTLTIAVPGRIGEHARVRIRNGRGPLVRRLS